MKTIFTIILVLLFLPIAGFSQMTEAGLRSYSVKPVQEQQDTAFVHVYYNAEKLESYLVINSSGFKSLELTVFNVLGKKVYSYKDGPIYGNYFTTVLMNDLPNGVYIFKIKTDNKTYYRRMLRSE